MKISNVTLKLQDAQNFQNEGEYEKAILKAGEAQSMYREMGWGDGMVSTSGLILNNYLRLLEIDSARIIRDSIRTFLDNYALGDIYHVIGNFSIGNYFLTISEIDSARFHFRKLPPLLVDPTIHNWDFMPDEERAWEKMITQAAKQYVSPQIELLRGHSFNGLGLTYLANLEFTEAENAFSIARTHYQKAGSGTDQVTSIINRAQTYLTRKHLDPEYLTEALRQFREALDLALQLDKPDQAQIGLLHRFLGYATAMAGDSTEALSYYQKGMTYLAEADDLELSHKMGIPPRTFQYIYRLEKAILEMSEDPGKADETIMALEKEFAVIVDTAQFLSPTFALTAYNKVAEAHLLLRNWDRALSWYDQALSYFWPTANPLTTESYDISQVMDVSNIQGIQTLINIARAYERRFRLTKEKDLIQQSLMVYQAAADVFDAKRFLFTSSGGGGSLQQNALISIDQIGRDIYSGVIRTNLKASTDETEKKRVLMEYIRKNQAFSLSYALNSIGSFRGVPDPVIKREQQLKRKITTLQKQQTILNQKQSVEEDQRLQLNKKVIEIQDSLDVYYQDLKRNHLLYASLDTALNYKGIDPELLDEATAILEYHIDPEGYLYAACTTVNSGVTISEQSLPEAFYMLVDQLTTFTGERNAYQDVLKTRNYLKAAHALYELLIGPFEKQLTGISRLIITPDQQLHRINFDCLLYNRVTLATEATEGTFSELELPVFAQYPWLIKKYETQYIHSLTTLQQQKKLNQELAGKAETLLPYAAFEPIYQLRSAADVDSLLDQSLYRFLKEHKFENLRMVEQIAPLFERQQVWTGTNANELVFNKIMDSTAINILHLSAHGWLDDQNPIASKMLLTHIKGDDELDDAIEVRELYHHRISARLAILSSCNSGNSHFAPTGEGLVSIGRGFFFAGCPSVIIGRWPLIVGPTRDIVAQVCMDLRQSLTPAAALRKAKLNYLETTRNPARQAPYFWAGLSLWGDNEVLFPRN